MPLSLIEIWIILLSIYVIFDINFFKAPGLIQFFVNKGHCRYPVLAFNKNIFVLFIFDILGLKFEKTGNYLHIVVYSMMDFPKKHFFFLKGLIELQSAYFNHFLKV